MELVTCYAGRLQENDRFFMAGVLYKITIVHIRQDRKVAIQMLESGSGPSSRPLDLVVPADTPFQVLRLL